MTLLLDVVLASGCDDGIKPSATTEQAPDAADQLLVKMEHLLTTQGVVRAKIEADTAYIHSGPQLADMRNVRVTFYDAQGNQSSTLTARVGSYQFRSGDMEGRGNVVVIRKSDGGRLTTEVLRYSQVKDSVSSDRPFEFNAPDQQLRGEGFTADPSFRTVIAIRPTGSGNQPIKLPNQ
ncbi:MAG TPA: LPS export ABC transporter periplasmic protein LptC [Gemmatimonadales bacterium]